MYNICNDASRIALEILEIINAVYWNQVILHECFENFYETAMYSNLTNSEKVRNSVMPAKAGIQNYLKILDSRLRGNDIKGRLKTFYETIKFIVN